jgi:hypothetical protein
VSGVPALRLRIATVMGLSCAVAVLFAGCDGSAGKSSGTGGSTTAAPATSPASIGSATSTASTATSSLSPVPKILDQKSVQDGVRRVLTESYLLTGVEDVSCPANQEVTVGATFDCTVAVGSEEKTVTITVQTAEGQYEVGQPK